MERRRFLKTLGVTGTATMTGLAGCGVLGAGTSNGERASYDAWVSSDEGSDGAVSAFTLELSLLRKLENQTTTATTTTSEETTTAATTTTGIDPLSAIPGTYVFSTVLGFGIGFAQTGLTGLVKEGGSAETIHLVGGSFVLEGSYDVENVRSKVSESVLSEAESYEGYTLYRAGSGQEGIVVAVSDEAVVYVSGDEETPDPTGHAKTLVDTGSGSGDRYRNDSEDYDQLVTALPSRDLQAVEFSTDGGLFESESDDRTPSSPGIITFSDVELSGNALGGSVSASLSQDELESALAFRYANEDEVDAKADIEAALGGQADERSVTVDGRMVYVEGRFEQK